MLYLSTVPALTVPPPLAGTCPESENEDDWMEYGSFCFHFAPHSTESWRGAIAQCLAKHPLATLTSIHNHVDNEFIRKNMATTYYHIWLGMFRSKNGMYVV